VTIANRLRRLINSSDIHSCIDSAKYCNRLAVVCVRKWFEGTARIFIDRRNAYMAMARSLARWPIR
jgi:hypothetical protein